jgi:hypothetical protein
MLSSTCGTGASQLDREELEALVVGEVTEVLDVQRRHGVTTDQAAGRYPGVVDRSRTPPSLSLTLDLAPPDGYRPAVGKNHDQGQEVSHRRQSLRAEVPGRRSIRVSRTTMLTRHRGAATPPAQRETARSPHRSPRGLGAPTGSPTPPAPPPDGGRAPRSEPPRRPATAGRAPRLTPRSTPPGSLDSLTRPPDGGQQQRAPIRGRPGDPGEGRGLTSLPPLAAGRGRGPSPAPSPLVR